jgi:hypothetical protein
MENKITNYSKYNESMKKSLLDKIFFIDKIEADIIVDYGCADGTLIKFLSDLFPSMMYVGFDIDKDMLELAKEKCGEGNFFFTDNWDLVEIELQGKVSAVVLNSVIHEVYAYGTRADVDNVWKRVYDKFDYVIIRDMIPSVSMDKRSDINDITKILRKGNSGLIRDFEQVWGSIEQNKNLHHFLLKYRYEDNWEREVRENYFPLNREELLSSIPEGYEIDFHEHFVLPFLKNVVKKDFNITIKDNTHLKLILKKVK